MKRGKWLLVVLPIIGFLISSCDDNSVVVPSDLTKNELRGKVQSVQLYSLLYNGVEENELVIQKNYNEDGYMTSSEDFESNNGTYGSRKTNRFLDEDNRLLYSIMVRPEDRVDSTVFHYENDLLSELIEYSKGNYRNTVKYQYDDRGREIEMVGARDSIITFKQTFQYKTDLHSVMNEFDGGGILTDRIETEMSPDSSEVIAIHTPYPSHHLEKTYKIKTNYNEFNHIVNQDFMKNDSIVSQTKYEYVYDTQNNWLTKKMFENDSLMESWRQEIVYYE